MRVLIAGCGYVGSALAALLASRGAEVFGLRRKPAGLPPGVRPVAADLLDPAALRALPHPFDLVFYTAGASAGDDDAYRAAYVDGLRNVIEALGASAPRRVLLTSSTSVYAVDDGGFVDETTPAEPAHFTGSRVREGERLLAASGRPHVVLRLGGIYGPGRTRLLESVREGRAVLRSGPPVFTNRIHRDDCAGALAHLAALADPAPLYVGVDRDPAPESEVLAWLAARLGVRLATATPEAAPAAPARRPRASKRCRSDLLVASGYRFRFPTFREGYEAVLRGMGLALALALVAPAARADDRARPPAWSTRLYADHPLVGVVWDVRAGEAISLETLVRRLPKERYVLLGERHDQPDHHALQAFLLRELVAAGRRPAVAFEMFDASQQAAIDRHRAVSPADAAGLGAVAGFETSGWPDWSLYAPIAEVAFQAGLPVRAANLGRDETRRLSREGDGALDPALVARLDLATPLPEAERSAIEAEIVEGHCGHAPASALPRMVQVQRARDAHMARALLEAGTTADGAVLVAGNGHVRRDHGVPARLATFAPGERALSVGLLEVVAGSESPSEYAADGRFDYVIFTPRRDDEDACAKFRAALESLGGRR